MYYFGYVKFVWNFVHLTTVETDINEKKNPKNGGIFVFESEFTAMYNLQSTHPTNKIMYNKIHWILIFLLRDVNEDDAEYTTITIGRN